MWYAAYENYSVIEYSLIFGVYGGVFTGLLVDTLSQRVTLAIASILSVTSYCLIPQFDGSSRTKQEDWHFYILAILVFLAGQSVSLALLSTVKV